MALHRLRTTVLEDPLLTGFRHVSTAVHQYIRLSATKSEVQFGVPDGWLGPCTYLVSVIHCRPAAVRQVSRPSSTCLC